MLIMRASAAVRPRSAPREKAGVFFFSLSVFLFFSFCSSLSPELALSSPSAMRIVFLLLAVAGLVLPWYCNLQWAPFALLNERLIAGDFSAYFWGFVEVFPVFFRDALEEGGLAKLATWLLFGSNVVFAATLITERKQAVWVPFLFLGNFVAIAHSMPLFFFLQSSEKKTSSVPVAASAFDTFLVLLFAASSLALGFFFTQPLFFGSYCGGLVMFLFLGPRGGKLFPGWFWALLTLAGVGQTACLGMTAYLSGVAIPVSWNSWSLLWDAVIVWLSLIAKLVYEKQYPLALLAVPAPLLAFPIFMLGANKGAAVVQKRRKKE